MTRLARLPLRLRLVAGFAVAITVVLTGAGAFVYWRVSYALDRRLDSDLRGEASALAPLVSADGRLQVDVGLDRTAGAQQYQVLAADGVVLSRGSEVGTGALLSGAEARAAGQHEVLRDIGALLPRSSRPLRVLGVALPAGQRAAVLVVAERRDERDEALRELLAQLLVAGLAVLVVSTFVGDRLAKAALAPVERYRARAVTIAAGARGVRLEVPPGRDDEVTRLGHTLNDVLDALEQALDAERRFTQDASHELRTPLTLLSTRVQLALRRPRTTAEHEATLHELSNDVRALSKLAEQLLQLSTSQASTTSNETADLAALARTSTGCTVVVHHEPLLVTMSEVPLRQVLGNLVGNASHHGAGTVKVEVRRATTAGVVTVTDGGTGVDPGFVPIAVERFAREDVARGRPGAGLGLALVHDLVLRHGGELRLCSRGAHHRYVEVFDVPCTHPPAGTTATVLLPLP